MKLRIGLDCGQVTDPTAIVVVEISGLPSFRGLDGTTTTDPANLNPLSPLGLRAAGLVGATSDAVPPGLPEPRRRRDGRDGREQAAGEPPRRIPGDEATYTARHLERIKLGTSYLDVASRVRVILEKLRRRVPTEPPDLYVDNTGVGLPVVDILRRELAGIPHRLVPVGIVAGDGYHDAVMADGQHGRPSQAPRSSRGLRVGKGFLVSRLQALIQCDRMLLPDHPESDVLMSQLKDFQVRAKISHDEYGSRSGTHDDLVIAAALAVLDRPRQDVRAVTDINASMRDPQHVGYSPRDVWQLPR